MFSHFFSNFFATLLLILSNCCNFIVAQCVLISLYITLNKRFYSMFVSPICGIILDSRKLI